MKLSNNAIKFLMAQYRAIYKNAYFKGIASAVVLTAGMAAGAAQAAPGATEPTFDLVTNAITDAQKWADLSGYKKADNSKQTALSGVDTATNTNEFFLKLTSGDHSITTTANSGSTVTADKGTIIVEGENAALKVTTSAAKPVSLTLLGLDVKKGSVKVTGSGGSNTAILGATTILIGNGDSETADSKVEIGKAATLGKTITAGALSSNTSLTLNSDGSIVTAKPASGANTVESTINAAVLTINGGKITATDGDKPETDNSKITINLVSGSIAGGTIDTASKGEVDFKFSNTAVTGVKKELSITGGTLDIKNKVLVDGGGTVVLGSGATVKGGGDFTISGTGTTLKTDAATLTKAAAGSKLTINAGTLDLGTAELDMTAGGLAFGGTASAGTIGLAGNANIKAGSYKANADLAASGNVTVDTATFTKADGAALELTNTKLKANNGLTVDANLVLKGGMDLGAASVDTINASEGFAKLKDTEKTAKLLAHTGTISAGTNTDSKLVLGENGALNIKNGSWTADVAVAVGSGAKAGALTVGSGVATKSTAASLKFNAGSSLDLTSGTVTVGAENNSPLSATLDLSALTADKLTLDSSQESTLSAKKGGTIVLNTDLVSKLTASASKVKTDISGGALDINGDLEIAQSKLVTSAAVGSIAFTAAGSKLTADSIKITGAGTAVTAGTGSNLGTIETGVLTLDGAANAATKLGSGNFVVTEELAVGTGTGINLEDGSVLKLGDLTVVDGANITTTTTGSVGAALTLNKGKLDVQAGSWGAGDITLTSGGITVGNEVTTLGADGNPVAASLTAKKFKLVDGTAKVKQTGTLTVSDFDAAKGVTVDGTLTINGTSNVDPAEGNINGLKLAANSVTVGATGTLNFGSNISNSFYDAAGTEKGVFSITTGKMDAIEAISVNDDVIASGSINATAAGSKINFNFDKGVAFKKEGIESLKSEIFSGAFAGVLNLGLGSVSGLTVTPPAAEGQPCTVEWKGNAAGFKDVLPNITNEEYMQAQLTKVDSSETITGHWGSVKSEDAMAGAQLSVNYNTSLNNAVTVNGEKVFAVNGAGEVLGLKADKNTNLELNNGGKAGKITLGENAKLTVNSDAGATVLDKVDGSSASLVINGSTTVAKGVNVDTLDLSKDLTVTSGDTTVKFLTSDAANAATASLTARKLVVNGDGAGVKKIDFAGRINAEDASFNDVAVLSGDLNLTKAAFSDAVTLSGKNNKIGDATLAKDGHIAAGTTAATSLTLGAADSELLVGSDVSKELPNGAGATLLVDTLNLGGGIMIVDPAYGQKASLVAVKQFKDLNQADEKVRAGKLNGDLAVLQNSIVALGVDTANAQSQVQYDFASLLDENGSLSADKTGAIAYINKSLTMDSGDHLTVDAKIGHENFAKLSAGTDADATAYQAKTGNNVYIGANSALAVSRTASVNDDGRYAVEFNDDKATIYAEDGAKILLTGAGWSVYNSVNLFKDNGQADPQGAVTGTDVDLTVGKGEGGVDGKLVVETVNGLLQSVLKTGTVGSVDLEINKEAVKTMFSDASEPVRQTLFTYAAKNHNWDSTDVDAPIDALHNGIASEYKYVGGKILNAADDTEVTKKDVLDQLFYVDMGQDTTETVYYKAGNALLDYVAINSHSGREVENAARLGAFGGASQAALTATSTTSDAVSGRFGMGNAAASLTYADNGQGTGMWVTPVYRSADSDGFGAEGVDYGSDVSIFGVALGGDYSLGNGLRAGAMINIGSGDADGQGAASAVTNEFNYFGGALYAGYSMDALSIVADLSYTTVDSDVEAGGSSGKLSSSFDTTTMSLGVTGQYAMDLGGVEVTPHAGLRFTRIDMDDYTVDLDSTEVASFATSAANVFSIPVGVSIAKEYVMDTWTVKPAFDLTLTGNFGDDTADGTVHWTGVENLATDVKTEFMDSFTYGTAIGVAAKSGNLGLGVGLNYTGSSNVKEFGANATVRYVF
ncbi:MULTISPECIES: autotransporter domain-containing protein [unclassified Anaerobiospirillum]|uniref:autotransporter domain-containing protein n=1 Tax=unclassified Anaerobiospirillum TaxID=2647410 RepID=UPI001FF5B529|nr:MULTISPECIES: autotransporter domain-containing protein [unclassified Anaerobiospirillum]MCK0535500.1 autotransporter domain-containing protein [Anaerobiospirillum sp. NML120511]MCK0540696.1 autotransporter domain-containing protein [Anaerobiospirillum sp. NML02-A-032]